jgi:predicted lipoprotein with Yx(FWY)xxD motif
VTRPDGTYQLKAGKWPLYRFSGDGAPGDVNGQGFGGVWFVVTPTGGLLKS